MTDMTIQNYNSRMDNDESLRYETFSYLPEMDKKAQREQIKYIVSKGWNCAIEHVEVERAADTYWYMWKLPMFGEKDVDKILSEIAECKAANPNDHIRLIGYDNLRQTQGSAMVVHRGKFE